MSQSSEFPPAIAPPGQAKTDTGGLRAAGKARSRSRLLQAARHLFAEHGYEGATMREIAAAAGLSTGAVFASFSDKADLFNAVLIEDSDVQGRLMRDAAAGGGPVHDRLLKVFQVAYDFHLGELQLLRAAIALSWSQGLTGELGDRPIRDGFSEIIGEILAEAAGRGELKRGTGTALIVETLWEVYISSYRCAVFAGWDRDRLVRRMGDQIDLVLAGQRAG